MSVERPLESLSAGDKRALLARLLRERAARPARFPLSAAQQRLWFLDQLDSGKAAYNVHLALGLDGELSWRALAAGVQEIVRRHQTLRTTFESTDDQTVQVISPEGVAGVPLADLRGLPADARRREADRLTAELCKLPFDLRRGPLLRVHLLRLAAAEWALLLVLHHIVADGWSLAVFVRELAALYTAAAAGRPSPLPELPFHYVEFVRRQARQLQGSELDEQLAYWRERLGDRPPALELPTDRPRPAVRTGRGASRTVVFPPALRERLAELGQREGATPYMVLLAVLQAVLHGHTGQRDIAVGSPITGRNRRELEGLIGLLVNTLVLRTDLSGDPTVRELLRRVRAVALGAYAHQALPFDRLVGELKIERDLSRTPLFQVMLALQDAPLAAADLAGLALRVLPVAATTAKLDLNLEVRAGAAGLVVYAEYDRDLFDATSIVRLLGHLETFLAGASRRPDARLSTLPLLGAGERHQVLAEWNDSAVARQGASEGWEPELLHRPFEAQAARTPGATALVCEGERLAYREVEERANALAWRLRELGCGPESAVGIFLERSLALVVSLLAVLKAGAAYVPLDPDLPAERLRYQAASARLTLILAQGRLVARLPPAGCPVLTVDGEGAAAEAARPPDPVIHPDHPAYVLFTSGSTGRPKGVVVSHRAIANRLDWMQRAYRLTAADRVLQKTPTSFDVSVWELFWPLGTGAALVLARPGGHRDNAYLVRLIGEERITVLHFVPSMLQMFLDEPGVESCRSLREVVASGEALPAELAESFFARLGARLHNLYGPTEAAVDVTSWACERGRGRRAVPIGRPIANTRIHLLGCNLGPVPVGAAGELHIGGVNLARGYVGRPDLTAERFVPDPLAGEPGARLYRTGDLARHRSDGAVEYLGRTDQQVKVRGFRIELAEIEAALAALPAVRESAVAAREEEGGHRRLVAYVVPAGAAALEPEALRRSLGERLPEYMVPALFVPLERLPLTPSGKLDRRALPAPEAARPVLGLPYAPPAGEDEEALAEIWSGVLGVERVGRDDNFFALGGDSILSLKVISRARERGLPFALQQIFRSPTVAALAAAIRAARPASGAPLEEAAAAGPFELVSTADRGQLPEGLEDAYPLARLQAGMLFHSELDPETGVYHDVFSVHLEAPFDEALLRRAAGEVVARHPALRTTFDLATFGEPLQLVHRAMAADLAVDDIRHLDARRQEEHLAAWMKAEKSSPLDWSAGPLVRFRVHRRSAGSFQLVLSFHHAALDGWSVAALMTELLRTYLSLRCGGGPAAAAPPPGAYRRFVALERRAMESPESRRYWRDRLAGASFAAVARWRQPAPADRGSGLCERGLDRGLSERLEGLARAWGVPVKSVLLAAHCRVQALLTGEDRPVTGLVVNGRPEEEGGERALGLFLNTLPLCLDPAASSWRELVRRTFESERELLAHRRFPLAELRRGAGSAPLFEMVFNFVHFHVYQQLSEFDEIRPLGSEFFEQTNFPLLASFGKAAFSARLHLRLEYDPRQFPPEQVAAIAGRYEQALAALAADPEAACDAVPLLSPAERHQVLWEWNDTAASYPPGLDVHALCAARALARPDAVAVTCEGRYLSYGELERAAGRLARRLHGLGCGPETLVAVALERSLDLVVALLAVLRAGAAYVPVDLEHPPDRIAALLAAAHPAALVTAEPPAPRLPAVALPRIGLDLAAGGEAAGGLAAAPSEPAALAYTIYTSGSTGRPKGAMVARAGLYNRLMWMQEALRLAPGDVVLQKTPFTFDVSVWEFFWPLLAGARLVLARPGGHRDPSYLAELVAGEGVTVLHFVPSMLQSFLEEPEVSGCRSLRLVVASGEALSPELERRFFERSAAELYNLYGPTEASIDVSWWRCTPGGHRAVPIGRPIANTALHVLDRHLQPVGVGSPGELAIGGFNVGRGYLDRPERTAERFVPDPFGAPGARLYRTGDLARLGSGGAIEFLGRIDHQVKLRGFRIEPGEIEAVLLRHPAVREAVVVARDDLPGGRGLAAYLVTSPDTAPEPSELRAFLKTALPEPMVPAAFVRLAALPLTANGKLDRRALPAPQASPAGGARPFVAPRDPVEQLVARIWCEVLGLERVSVEENFFESGGHSLLATQVVARVRRGFGIALPLRAFFERPTVAELAQEVAAGVERRGGSDRIAGALQAVRGMSAEEIQRKLQAKRRAGGAAR